MRTLLALLLLASGCGKSKENTYITTRYARMMEGAALFEKYKKAHDRYPEPPTDAQSKILPFAVYENAPHCYAWRNRWHYARDCSGGQMDYEWFQPEAR